MMRIVLMGIVLAAVVAAALWLRFGGVTHARICERVVDESDAIQARIDMRYEELDRRLDCIEGKLDRILEIANRPMADGMREVRQ